MKPQLTTATSSV